MCQKWDFNGKLENTPISNGMPIENEIRILTNQHTALERQISTIMEKDGWDQFFVEDLKKKKLIIKDKLATLYKERHNNSQIVDMDDR